MRVRGSWNAERRDEQRMLGRGHRGPRKFDASARDQESLMQVLAAASERSERVPERQGPHWSYWARMTAPRAQDRDLPNDFRASDALQVHGPRRLGSHEADPSWAPPTPSAEVARWLAGPVGQSGPHPTLPAGCRPVHDERTREHSHRATCHVLPFDGNISDLISQTPSRSPT
eukprot:4390693-Prymnesium_polylepis.1